MHVRTINSDTRGVEDVDAAGNRIMRHIVGIATVRVEAPGNTVGFLFIDGLTAKTGMQPATEYTTTTWDVAPAALVSGF